MVSESRRQSRVDKLKGPDIMALERFAEDTKHRVVFGVLSSDSPIGDKGDRMRLFLTDEGYKKALKNQENRHIKIRNHAKVSAGHLHYEHRDRDL